MSYSPDLSILIYNLKHKIFSTVNPSMPPITLSYPIFPAITFLLFISYLSAPVIGSPSLCPVSTSTYPKVLTLGLFSEILNLNSLVISSPSLFLNPALSADHFQIHISSPELKGMYFEMPHKHVFLEVLPAALTYILLLASLFLCH